jgi:hypothetical protein
MAAWQQAVSRPKQVVDSRHNTRQERRMQAEQSVITMPGRENKLPCPKKTLQI